MTIHNSCSFLDFYNWATLFQRNPADALSKIGKIKPSAQNKIYESLWKIKGSPSNLHADYGRVCMFNLEGFNSTAEERAKAVEMALQDSVSQKLKNEMNDALKQQTTKKPYQNHKFDAAQSGTFASQPQNPEKAKRDWSSVAIAVAKLFTVIFTCDAIQFLRKEFFAKKPEDLTSSNREAQNPIRDQLYACANAFKEEKPNAKELLTQLPDQYQNKIFNRTWKIKGFPQGVHDDFGRECMYDRLPGYKLSPRDKYMIIQHVAKSIKYQTKGNKTLIEKTGTGSTLPGLTKRSIGIAGLQRGSFYTETEALAEDTSFRTGSTNHQFEIYGIFDGHRGYKEDNPAKFCKQHLSRELKAALERHNPKDLTDAGIFAALKDAFLRLDKAYKGAAGSTAAVAIILNNELWVANVGNSRVVLNNGGNPIQLSEDQTITDPKYKKGIEKRNGFIEFGCVKGENRSTWQARAIGDHNIKLTGDKEEHIPHTPKITKYSLRDLQPDSSLIVACDGLWDVCSTKQAVAYAYKNNEKTADLIAEGLTTKALHAAEYIDNLSAIVVKFG